MFVSNFSIILDPASGVIAPALAAAPLQVTVQEALRHHHHLPAQARDLRTLALPVRGHIHARIGRREGRGVYWS